MNGDPTSLDRLHDIVAPQPVPFWPPAPGWYLLLAVLAVALVVMLVWGWKQWRANAYRRAALRELESADDVTAISELLRRTALAVAPRQEIAAQVGTAWPQWLAAKAPEPMPAEVRRDLAVGVYEVSKANVNLADVPRYAADWIRRHRVTNEDNSNETSVADRSAIGTFNRGAIDDISNPNETEQPRSETR